MRRRALLAVLPLAACTGHEMSLSERNPQGFLPWSDAAPEYRIAAGDRLRVSYLLTPELNEVALVAPDGQVALRAAGRVEVAGLPMGQAEARITQASRRYLTEPLVTLGVEEAQKDAWYRYWIDVGLEALERSLARDAATGHCCHGDTPTLADVCLVPQLANARRVNMDLAPYPTLTRIDAHCRSLPAFAAAAPAQQPDAEG